MSEKLIKGIILALLTLIGVVVVFPAAAETVPLQEAGLYYDGEAAGVYQSESGDLFVVDNTRELWRVNPVTGAYTAYFPVFDGIDYLADIAMLPGDNLWWSSDGTLFGNLNLVSEETQTWSVDDLNPIGESLNLGPVIYNAEQAWLASWIGPKFGLFRFNPATLGLCLYAFPDGLNATDLAVHDGLLWALDWRSTSSDSLFSWTRAAGAW